MSLNELCEKTYEEFAESIKENTYYGFFKSGKINAEKIVNKLSEETIDEIVSLMGVRHGRNKNVETQSLLRFISLCSEIHPGWRIVYYMSLLEEMIPGYILKQINSSNKSES